MQIFFAKFLCKQREIEKKFGRATHGLSHLNLNAKDTIFWTSALMLRMNILANFRNVSKQIFFKKLLN